MNEWMNEWKKVNDSPQPKHHNVKAHRHRDRESAGKSPCTLYLRTIGKRHVPTAFPPCDKYEAILAQVLDGSQSHFKHSGDEGKNPFLQPGIKRVTQSVFRRFITLSQLSFVFKNVDSVCKNTNVILSEFFLLRISKDFLTKYILSFTF